MNRLRFPRQCLAGAADPWSGAFRLPAAARPSFAPVAAKWKPVRHFPGNSGGDTARFRQFL